MRTEPNARGSSRSRSTGLATAGWLVLAAAVSPAQGQERSACIGGIADAPSVYIDSSAAEVTVVTTDGRRFNASRNLLLCPGDEVQTGATGRVAIRFDEKRTVIRLDGNSRTRVLSGGTGSADASLLSGILYFVSSVRRHFEVDTPYIVAGIDGTEALVAVQPANALAMAVVREGLVSAYDHAVGPGKTLVVAGGEAAFRSATVPFQSAPIGELPPPFRELLIASDSAVDWAVYFPPIMFAGSTPNPAVREAIQLLSSGDYDRAAAALAGAASADPAATASLLAIIAVARNRLDEAERWSAEALAADPQFAPAQVAASYVRQARGDLDGALEFALAAEKIAPADAYVIARVAELQMTIGDRRAALRNAERSLEIARTPLALFVAGLARLAASQYAAAEALFNEAISLDPEGPLPRLGLGLAYIRQGKTAAGTWEIERAVIHDPRRASLRTWLGRAYFDEELSAKAAEELRLSKLEDPDDPTPYLFSAIERYAANRPIIALRELQEAEKRGRARRVLRSATGLAEDTATRGAALGRVYDVLGFEQLAINEGTKAAEADPANPGAHRFLADAYRQRPLHEIAQTSELLRSQLLSPPSKTPVQPELAENDLALLDTTGPSRVTFAEFSPLFDADGLRFDASGLVGTQQTWSEQAAATALYRNASVSIGQFHYETQGYGDNNDLSHDIFNAISTLALSPEFSLFGEYRFRESDGGDRAFDFDGDFNPTVRTKFEREVARVGFHAEPSVNSDLIGVYTFATLSTTASVIDDPPTVTVTTGDDQSHNGQLQHIYQDGSLQLVTGGSYLHNDVSTFFDEGGIIQIPDSFSVDYFNAYSYFSFDAPARVTWTFGGALAKYDEGDGRNDIFRFLPKIGVRAELTDWLTFRAAYLKNLKPNLVSEQVIEPTSVSGFNQFYDGFNGTVIEQAGGGLDLRPTAWLNVGGEAIGRWWEIPQVAVSDGSIFEQVYRAYAYLTLTDRIALAADLIDERSEADDFFPDFDHWRTTSVPVTVSYFDPTGFFGSAGIVFVDHSFTDGADGGDDQFHVVNATLGYRLPRNRGVFSLEALNILDEEFHYQNRTLRPDVTAEPRFAPEPTVFVRGSVRF